MKISFNPFKKPTKPITTRKTCQQCQTAFDCNGCADTGNPCWCARYPTALTCDNAMTDMMDASADCLCPNCLTDIANADIKQSVDTVEVHTFQPKLAKAHVEKHGLKPLIKGVDYTLNAQGNMVLSRWFLLKKGKCCGNGCANCPYGHVNVKK